MNQLGPAWAYALHASSKWGSAAGAPLIAGNRVYFQDLQSNVYAFDFKTGDLIWRNLARQSAFGPNGPGIGWGKVFVQDGGNHLVALDITNGHQLWTSPMFGPAGANQPVPFGGYVYTGVPDGEISQDPGQSLKLNKKGTSGYTFGFDQETGKMIWSFQTVEEGFWGHPEVNSGAGVWYSPAIDPKTGMVFWSTGNPAPMPGTVDYPNASSRPGPNLYSETVLAFEGKTGKLLWYNQVRPHDILNYDLQNSPVLSTAQINGQQKDVVIATGKMGYVYCIDKLTGEMYWKTPVGQHQKDDLQDDPRRHHRRGAARFLGRRRNADRDGGRRGVRSRSPTCRACTRPRPLAPGTATRRWPTRKGGSSMPRGRAKLQRWTSTRGRSYGARRCRRSISAAQRRSTT